MGFFDSVIPADKSASAGGQSSSAIAEPVAAPAVANDADFLIIDENVTVSDVPDTVSTVSEADDRSEAESAPLLDFSSVETAAPETVEAEAEAAPALTEAEVESADVVTLVEDSVEVESADLTLASEVSSSGAEPSEAELSAPAGGFLSLVSDVATETAPAVAEVETAAPVSDSLEPDDIILSTVSQLKQVVSSKESARDKAMSENETILAELAAEEEAFKAKKAELKARASEAQERAREIDASADRARSLISNLESQLIRAA